MSSFFIFKEKLVFSFFFAGAILCLGLSFTFHTVSCHSKYVVRIFSRFSYKKLGTFCISLPLIWVSEFSLSFYNCQTSSIPLNFLVEQGWVGIPLFDVFFFPSSEKKFGFRVPTLNQFRFPALSISDTVDCSGSPLL